MFGLVVAVLAVSGALVALCACYLLSLAVASIFHRELPASGEAMSRLAVVVPAHDEEEMISACVRSLLEQDYPRERCRVVVVADNCTDGTESIARAAGAEVWVRLEPDLRGKGYTLRWAMDRLLAEPAPDDAVVVVDADSVADRSFLRALEARFRAGHRVVQADYRLLTRRSDPRRALLEAAALLLRNRVRLAGQAVLGLPASLSGNGMLLGRWVLASHPWSAFTATEDAEYALALLAAGEPTTFAARARVMARPTASAGGAYTQSLRWDGGRLALARCWMPRLLRAGLRGRDAVLIGAALDLAVPPLGVLVLATLVGNAVTIALAAAGVVGAGSLVPWLVALLSLPCYLLTGLSACRVPAATYGAFLLAPWFLARKLRVYARLARGIDDRSWVRTERLAEARSSEPRPKGG